MLTDLILRAKLPIGIFTLDTGRLHPETLACWSHQGKRYGYDIKLYRPEPGSSRRLRRSRTA